MRRPARSPPMVGASSQAGTVRLITNNPKKVNHLNNLGINVTERIPIKIKPNKHN
ncbi:MAG: hypothetical protein EBY52_04255, partial [Actinobacteria bacterium]|nr:hypothetical protein [Actinomycetota bacterium]